MALRSRSLFVIWVELPAFRVELVEGLGSSDPPRETPFLLFF
jgi:hypothetical protein